MPDQKFGLYVEEMRLTFRRCTKVVIVSLLTLFALYCILKTDARLLLNSTKNPNFQHKHGGYTNGSRKTLNKRHERSLTSTTNLTDPAKDSGNILQLHDIMISIKTTQKYHKARLKILLETWIKNAINEVRIAQAFSLSLKLALSFAPNQLPSFCCVALMRFFFFFIGVPFSSCSPSCKPLRMLFFLIKIQDTRILFRKPT